MLSITWARPSLSSISASRTNYLGANFDRIAQSACRTFDRALLAAVHATPAHISPLLSRGPPAGTVRLQESETTFVDVGHILQTIFRLVRIWCYIAMLSNCCIAMLVC